MMERPPYFDAICQLAEQRWEQLEKDRELAGPWHQLFKQVQSPRHILSELLQNADDAGAIAAAVWIEDGVFIFEHDGEDFVEEHFASLCRFGYSNKRALHTIGFRGIGFKSTFSLGDQVELYTPSLCVAFRRHRFTEPVWLTIAPKTDGCTRIQVKISDHHRQREVEKNLEEWLKSPVSPLFFKNIRRMRIGDREVHWKSFGLGPVPDSEWMALKDKDGEPYLLIRSEERAFPEEALAEIRQERMLGSEEGMEFPPCKVEIVLGAQGRLYVVLPTGVETTLPFACNAPFVQDPARLKIKDPETSPTNRWLLERAGELAASAMFRWLGDASASLVERARAYGLFPDVDRTDTSLEGTCGATVEVAFAECIDGSEILLTEGGDLVPGKQAIILPPRIYGVWPAEQASALLDPEERPALYHKVATSDQRKLLSWGVIKKINKQQLLDVLREKHLPRPESWRRLLALWAYVAPEITGYRHYNNDSSAVKIVPVQGKDALYSASEVVHLGEKKLLQSEGDWEFLSQYLIVLNKNWTRFLAEQRRGVSEATSTRTREEVEAAYAVLEGIGLSDTSNASKVVDRAAAEFFSQDDVSLRDCIQFTQIAAKLGANVGGGFKYFTQECRLHSSGQAILFDRDGALRALLPDTRGDAQILHQDYARDFSSCSSEDWRQWIESGKAKLLTFVPLVQRDKEIYGRERVEQEARRRGYLDELSYRYVTNTFVLKERDFEETYWHHWETLAVEDERFWVKLIDRLLAQRNARQTFYEYATLHQLATTGNTCMTAFNLLPSWILKLRELPCLPDTLEVPRKPDDLLRRTPQTESLMGVEPFVHGLLDNETTRPLLELLGVRSVPTGPDRLLDRLRALAKADKPPVYEVEKWYRLLDQMFANCSTADCQKIKQTLHTEKLILTQDGAWSTASSVFLMADEEDVPDAAVICGSVSDLTLWWKVGVENRPTVELVIAWLQSLESGAVLSPEDARRVRSLLARHPVRIWTECGHWLNLAGEWSPVERLVYAITMQSLLPWRHFHPWVKQMTADLQWLPGEVTSKTPFSELPPLAAHVEERFQDAFLSAGQLIEKEWMRILGTELCRIEIGSKDETEKVRAVASRLAKTRWLETEDPTVIPYIDGKPAGTFRRAPVVWLDSHLYTDKLFSKAKLARRVPEELSKFFANSDIRTALDYSYDRSAHDVREYLAENFSLASPVALPPDSVAPAVGETEEHQPEEGSTPSLSALGTDEFAMSSDEVGVANEPKEGVQDTGASCDDGTKQQFPEVVDKHPRSTSKLRRLGIMERFAKAKGFREDGKSRFFHESGSWIGKTSNADFPWEQRTRSGKLERRYQPRDHCLEQEPLQLGADVWELIELHPDTCALVLFNEEGTPVEVTGDRLLSMREEGEVTLYPATYRLVYNQGRSSEHA